MLTPDEIKFLESCSDTELMKDIIERHSYLPEIIITISGGTYQFSHANMEMNLIVEYMDDIKNGGKIFSTSPSSFSQNNFNTFVKERNKANTLYQAKALRDIPVKEYRVFITDTENMFPYNVQVNGEIEGQFETMDEATEFLFEYLQVRKGNG